MQVTDSGGTRRALSVKLWSINRWLRYTGLRLFVVRQDGEDAWTEIGVAWYGLPGSRGWRTIEG